MKIIALGDHYHRIDDHNNDLPSLDEDLAPLCRRRFRRIDRFIKLALLGSARCVDGVDLDQHTTLCLVSGLAAMANTVSVQEQLFRLRRSPKPANFINTLSNSAGFYIASNLGLSGRNLFVSRGDQSLEAGLALAQQELLCQPSRQVLLGAVDECVMPITEHRQRMGVADNTVLGEGSHWFLLGNEGDALANIESLLVLPHRQALLNWLDCQPEGFSHFYTVGCDRLVQDCVLASGAAPYQTDHGCYGVRSAGVLTQFVREREVGRFVSISCDRWGRYHIVKVVL